MDPPRRGFLGASPLRPPLFSQRPRFRRRSSGCGTPYDFPNIHVDYVRVEPPGIPTAFWRGVGVVKNVFIVESLIDDLAAAVKQDPVTYRRSYSATIRALAC